MDLKLERKKKHLNQKRLQELSCVSRATISRIENGYVPSVAVAKRLASALGIDWHRFYSADT